jgi:hypothetical protein
MDRWARFAQAQLPSALLAVVTWGAPEVVMVVAVAMVVAVEEVMEEVDMAADMV